MLDGQPFKIAQGHQAWHARRVQTSSEPWAQPDTIRWILEQCQTWAIVGLADNPARAAHGVAKFLQRHGKRIVPVHPRVDTVWGEPGYASLADIPFPVDCVDVFRRLDALPECADQAIAIGARALWFQLDLIDEPAYQRATGAGLRVVMDRCPAIEGPRLSPASA